MSAVVDVPTDVETAWTTMTGPAWAPALAARLKDDSRLESSAPAADGGAVVVLSRKLPEGGPSYARALVPSGARVTQTDTWGPAAGGVRRATWSAELPGAPAQMVGEMLLEPTATGCRWTVSGTVTVKVPLVGGRVEGFLAPLVSRLVAEQGEVLRSLV